MTRAGMDTPLPLLDRLRRCAQLWCDANDATPARLGREVINDGGFFARIDDGAGATTATLERFARFFADVANWPEGVDAVIPQEVLAFVHVTGISPVPGEGATGLAGELSGHSEQKVKAA